MEIPDIKLYNVNKLGLIISQENGAIILDLRKRFRKLEEIKFILSCAFAEQPLIFMPSFSDKIKSTATLIEKGVLKKEIKNNGEIAYSFLI